MRTDTLATQIHFRWDRHTIDPTYMGNADVINLIRSRIDSLGIENIDSVVIISHASPEGSYRHNCDLSMRRAESMRRFMHRHFPQLDSRMAVSDNGESWQHLRQLILSDGSITTADKSRLVEIIDIPQIEVRKRKIAKDPFYSYIYERYYPQIRHSAIGFTFLRFVPLEHPTLAPSIGGGLRLPDIELPIPKLVLPPSKPQREIVIPSTPQKSRTMVKDTLTFALKSNLLYDLATALNVEVEVPIRNHFSIMAEYTFPWWETGNKYCLQIIELGAEARYYFSNNNYHNQKLRGHFLGLYGMSALYDVQYDRKINYQGELWSAGLTYGYAMRIAKWANLEFSLSVGYLSTAYRHYFPASDYSELWIDRSKIGRVGYFGPTKLKVSLVVPINIPYNKRGGSR